MNWRLLLWFPIVCSVSLRTFQHFPRCYNTSPVKPGRFEIAVLALFLLAGIYQLFIPPLIGIADNGDFVRLRYPNGLANIPSEADDQRFNYVHSKYAIVPEPKVGIHYFHSSSHLFVGAARWLNVLLVSSSIFDLRVLAAVYLVCFLLGIYLILIFTRKFAVHWRYLIAAALFIMNTDTAYMAYFNSFYSEPTALVALIIVVGCSLLLMSRQGGFIALAGYFAAAGLLITAKPMYVPFAALFIPFGAYLTRFVSFRFRWGVTGAVSCVLLILAAANYAVTPEWLRMKANYIAIFGVLLPDSPNPSEDLLVLNLRPEWIRYSGTTPYDADGPVETDAAFRRDFTTRVRTFTIPRYFLMRPAQLYRVAAHVTPQLVKTLPGYAGYYEESSGKPARSKPPAPWSRIRAAFFPASLWLVALYFGSGVLAFGLSFRNRLDEFLQGALRLYSLLVSFGALILSVSILTMASVDTRYCITFVMAFDMALILGAGMLLYWIKSLRQASN